MLSSSVLRCADWGVIKFLMEEIQHCGQNRGMAVFSTSCLEPTCPFSRSPYSFLRLFSFGSLPEEGNKAVCPNSEIRSQEAGRAWLLLRACSEGGLSTQGGCSLILEAGVPLTQTDLFSWQSWTRGLGLFLSSSFIQTAYKCSAGKGD